MNSEQIWETDTPTTLEEALQLLRFGVVLEKPLGDVDHVRTSRRMIACADFIERAGLASGEPVAYADLDKWFNSEAAKPNDCFAECPVGSCTTALYAAPAERMQAVCRALADLMGAA